MDQEHKKFNEAEMLIGGFFTLGVDTMCALIDFTGVGLAISPVIQSFTTFTMYWWFKSKGDTGSIKMGRQIMKYAANFLPVIPTTFTAFVIEVYIHNHPEKFALANKARALGSIDVKKIKDIKETKGMVSAAREARKDYHTAMEQIENEPAGITSTADIAKTSRAMNIPEPIG